MTLNDIHYRLNEAARQSILSLLTGSNRR